MLKQGSPSEYNQFIITSGKKELDVIKTNAISIVSIYFYENLLSPYITGVVTLASTGSVEGVSENEGLGNAKQLPIEAGSYIRLQIEPGTNLGPGLNFSSEEDVKTVITLCLRHRLRKDPLETIDSGSKVEKIVAQYF